MSSIDLSLYSPVTPLLTPSMSTYFSWQYDQQRCFDGDLTSFCATEERAQGENWVSVRVP